jgi:microcompartment protein CcmK/EutM
MNVPEGWVKRDGVKLKANAGLVEYHPAGDNDVRLNSYFRGNRISDDGAKAFTDCLNGAVHAIAKGSEELKSLSEVIDDKSGNFNISSAFTEVLNGKKVLVVEGAYKDAEHTTSRSVYVDSDGTGSVVQEISYTAPGSIYKTHLPAAEKALKSIKWK